MNSRSLNVFLISREKMRWIFGLAIISTAFRIRRKSRDELLYSSIDFKSLQFQMVALCIYKILFHAWKLTERPNFPIIWTQLSWLWYNILLFSSRLMSSYFGLKFKNKMNACNTDAVRTFFNDFNGILFGLNSFNFYSNYLLRLNYRSI